MAAFLERAQRGVGPAGDRRERDRRRRSASAPTAGRYVPEVLIPALDELSAAWAEARDDPEFRAELDTLLRDYVGRPTPLYLRRAALGAGRPPRLPEARGPRPHRRPQDQQRGRAGAARPPDGQAAGDRRDRRRPARRRGRHGVRAARPRVRRLHGHRGHAPPGAQRRADAAARRRGGAGRGRGADAQGGGQRRDPRLGGQRRARPTTSSARSSARRRTRPSFATSSG